MQRITGVTMRALPALMSFFLMPLALHAQDSDYEIVERDVCSGYEWDVIEGVSSYELVVMELPENEDPFPVIEVELPPSATNWTPTLDGCLEPGRDYLWSVRGMTPDGVGDWQPSVVFRANVGQVAHAPADESPEGPVEEPTDSPEPAQSSPGRSPIAPGTFRKLPERTRLPSSGLSQIGETEKNEPEPVIRQVDPRLSTRTLPPSVVENIQRGRRESLPVKIGYETEAEANAAAERAKREREQAELARQQNELERQRREEARKPKVEEQLPSPVINAVMDLQQLWVDDQHERTGDEYYIVTYKLRGRRGADDRIHVFDYKKQVWPIAAGKNWAKKGLKIDIPRAAGRLVFENLRPFEVYGFVAVLMEANKSTVEEREYAFGFGEFQNEEGLTETFSGAFERAVPRTTSMPDYNDTTRRNVSDVYELNKESILFHFGDYRSGKGTLASSIPEIIFEPLKRSNPDRLDGVLWGFSMNVPGGYQSVRRAGPQAIFPLPGEFMFFRTDNARIIGEHLQYE